jgi:mono/diheme cytochrome c family protein
MRRRGNPMLKVVSLSAMLLGIGAATSARSETVTITLPPDDIRLAPGPGADAAQTQCAFCHSLDYITTQPRGLATQWQGVVTKMIKVYGAPLSDADAKAISAYLATHYGL